MAICSLICFSRETLAQTDALSQLEKTERLDPSGNMISDPNFNYTGNNARLKGFDRLGCWRFI
jgi:hypothetical protein